MLLFMISLSYLWTYHGDSLYKGKIDGTIISRDSVFLGNKIESVRWESDGFISDIVKSGRELYFGISDLGLIIRDHGSGSPDTIINRKGGLISLFGKGDLIVGGLSPSGKLLFIKGTSIVDSITIPADNIYSILEWNGKFLIGTGPEGKIYQLGDNKEIKEFYNTQANSVTEMVIHNNKLFIGTANPGLVYEFKKDSSGRIYYDPDLEEVNGLGFVGDTLCVTGIKAGNLEPKGQIKFLIHNREFEVYKGTPILNGIEVGGRFYAGEGEDGQLGEFHRNGFLIVSDFDEPKITVLKNINGELYIGTGYPAKIYSIKNEKRREGMYTSSVFKGGIGIIWGNLFYNGRGDLTFLIRSGRKEEVDSSWTKWQTLGRRIDTEDPFVQWRVVLKGGNPYLKEVRISYRKRNSPPEIQKFAVLPPTIGIVGRNTQTQIHHPLSQEEKEKLRKMGFFIPDNSCIIQKGVRCIYWEAHDPDGDRLSFDLFLKRKDEEFRSLIFSLQEKAYFLNTSPYPDGSYIVKIVAKDLLDQPSPLSSEKTTSFLIDHTPPGIENIKKRVIGDSVFVSGTCIDKLSSISGTFYRTSKDEEVQWRRARPLDGLFDEKQESFSCKVDRESKYIAIRVFDRSNNDRVIRIEL